MSWSNSHWGSTPPPFADRGFTSNRAQANSDNAAASPSESEIESRLNLAEDLVFEYERGGATNVPRLRTAVTLLEMALDQLHPHSTQRPVALCQLCYAHTSQYLASESQIALDEAVRCGRLARDEGLDHGFRESDSGKSFDCYSRTLNNLGVALSHRAQRILGSEDEDSRNSSQTRKALQDLDEAIELARENKKILDDSGVSSDTAAANLASRLIARGSRRGTHEVDHAEALQLFKEIRQTAPATSDTHAAACLQIARLEFEAFQRTRNLTALDAALPAMEDSVQRISEDSEMFAQANHMMKSAYLDRHEQTGDMVDLAKALHFSARRLDARSIPQPIKDQYLLPHMHLLRRFALVTTSLVELQKFEQQASKQRSSMPRGFRDEFKCHRLHSDVVLKIYLLSRRLDDLTAAIHSIYTLLHDESGDLFVDGRLVQMNIGGYYKLRLLVARLVQVSQNQAKEMACEAIHACLSSACKPPDLVLGLMGLNVDAAKVLEIYEGCAGTGEVITKDVAERRAVQARQGSLAELAESRLTMSNLPSNATTAGQRAPSTDLDGHRQTLDFTRSISSIFGFDVTEPMSSKQFNARQVQAERRSMEKAKAEGKHPNPRLCLMCRSLKPLRPIKGNDKISGAAFEWNPNMSYLPLGTRDQLHLRKNCSICRLVLALIDTESDTESDVEILHPRLANADPKVHGTGLYVSEDQHTGERVLTVECNQRIVGYLRILPSKEPVSISSYLEAQFTPQSVRRSPTSVSRRADPEVLRGWLNNCHLRHSREACNLPTIPAERRYSMAIPLVFIDVLDRRLVPHTSSAKYFALSYVRGSVDLSNTRWSNYASRCQRGGLPSDLPATIEDAISLVRSLGERYLWVDALCIIQDDEALKEKVFGIMDVVYRNAFATIVALCSKNASGGILGIEMPWCRPERKEIIAIDVGSSDLEWTPDSKPGVRNTGNQKATVELIATPPRLDLAVSVSEWEKRGWTYQERLLSRRCLYFSDQTVYFRCGASVLAEGGVNGPVRALNPRWGWREEAVVENTLSRTLSDDGDIRRMGDEKRIEAMLAAYTKAVERYTSRQLTHDGDIINAFSGVLALLATAYKTDHWCGLPSSALSSALLWTPTGKTGRRGLEYLRHIMAQNLSDKPSGSIVPTNRGTVQVVYGPSEVTALDEKVDRQFPSWSWAGWKGPVDYRFFSDMHAHEPPPVSLIDKFAINLKGGQPRFIRGRGRGLNEPVISSPSSSSKPSGNAFLRTDRQLQTSEDQQFLSSPPFPNVLQFLTLSLPLTAFIISPDVEYISSNGAAHLPSRQAVRGILDRRGKRCGLWWEQAGYVYVGRGLSSEAEAKMLLVGVSYYKDTTTPRSGPHKTKDEVVTLFDSEVYSEVGPKSGLVNVLVVDLDMGHEFGERVTVARIHEKAWEEAGPSMRMIRLA